MAKDCLVTKLKGVVDNDSLPYYNQLTLHVSNTFPVTANTQKVGFGLIQGHSSFVVKAKGNGSFKYRFGDPAEWSETYVNEVTVPAGVPGIFLDVHEGEYDILLMCKYYIISSHYCDSIQDSFKNISYDISQLNYSNIRNLWTSGFPLTGMLELKDGSNMIDCSVNKFNAQSAGIPGGRFSYGINIDRLASATNLQVIFARDNNSVGSIESLSNCLNLIDLSLANTNVSGEILEVARKQVAAGRTTGVLKVGVVFTNCTFDGNPVTYESLDNHWTLFIIFDSTQQEGYRIQYTKP